MARFVILHHVTKGLNRLGKARRITGRRAFTAVFETNIRRACPPLVLVARPNELRNTRMGIAISRGCHGRQTQWYQTPVA